MRIAGGFRRAGRDGSRGATIVIVTVFLTVLVGLSFSLATISLGSLKEQRGAREELSAVFLAEAALGEAMFELETEGDGVLGTQQQPVSSNGGTFFVTNADLGGGIRRLLATSTSGRGEARAELVLEEQITNLFSWAAFGDETLTLDSNAMVDSYDSGDGTYLSQQVNGGGGSAYAGSEGNVGSNGDIVLESNTVVHGDATPGPGSTTTIIGGNADVTGSTVPNPTTIDFPPIEVPAIPSSGNLTVGGGTTISLPSGSHHFDNLTLDSTATMWITGPATLVFGSLQIKSNAQFRVDASAGPVDVYVIDDFLLNSNTLVASSTFTPADLRFNLLSDNVINPEVEVDLDDVDFDSNAKLYGTIYAPNAAIEIDSNFELFGALVARSIDLDSNSKIHYDMALMDVAENNQTTYAVICQRVLK